MKSFFFNAEPTTDIATHPTGYDREYDADDLGEFFAPFFSLAGVMATSADACKVTVLEGNTLQISPGNAYVKGRMCQFDGTDTITITEDSRIICRMNKTADVRAFQLIALPIANQPVESEDIFDLELATVSVTPVMGGYEAVVTDTRTFLQWMTQPAYYPPDEANLPYILWLYTLGFPMSAEQRAAVESNPSLLDIYKESVGVTRAVRLDFDTTNFTETVSVINSEGTSEDRPAWRIPYSAHKRANDCYTYKIYMHCKRDTVNAYYSGNTWGVYETAVRYDPATHDILIIAPEAYAGYIIFSGG